MNFGVKSLGIFNLLIKFPADCPLRSFQHTAKFRAGTIIPANTGKANNNNQAVKKIAQTNKGNLSKLIPGALMLIVVVIRFKAPIKLEKPAKCKAKIDKSTAGPEWKGVSDKGGYL